MQHDKTLALQHFSAIADSLPFSPHPEIQVKSTYWHKRWAGKENIWPALRCKYHDLVPKFSHLAWCNSVSFNLHWGAVYAVLCPFYGSLGCLGHCLWLMYKNLPKFLNNSVYRDWQVRGYWSFLLTDTLLSTLWSSLELMLSHKYSDLLEILKIGFTLCNYIPHAN